MTELKMGLATRDAYGKAIVELGKSDPRVVVLDADLSKSTKTAAFGKAYPDRFFNIGIAEANMVGIASGLAASGKTPFVSSFAAFLMCKGYDQIRMGIAYTQLPVRLVGSHAGITIGEDGASQMSIEDIALAVSLPGFTVCIPADEHAMASLLPQIGALNGPAYVRCGRGKVPIVHAESAKLTLGKAHLFRRGKDVALIGNGIMVGACLKAAEILAAEGIQATVADLHTVKPIDEAMLAEIARESGAIVACEEAQVWGGTGAAIAQAVAKSHPVPMRFVALRDTYAESGAPDELVVKYHLTANDVVAAAKAVIAGKGGR